MSWIVTRIGDGAMVGEFFDRRTVERINCQKYRVETAAEYLGRINAEIRASHGAAEVVLVDEGCVPR